MAGGAISGVLLSLVYRLPRCPFGLLSALVRPDLSKDVELLVLLCRENQVLRHRTGWDHADRLWFASLFRLVSRRRWPEIARVGDRGVRRTGDPARRRHRSHDP